jgi:xylulokinase
MFIGIDLGTSGVKALLIDDNQNIIASGNASLEVMRPHSGWSEQNPADWILATQKALQELAREADISGVEGIGLSGQMHGATLLDQSDAVLRPCILWNDTRSHKEAALLDGDPQFRKVTGNIVFPGFTAPKLLWAKNNEVDIFKKLAKVLLPKDYLRLWLTGEHVSEMSDAAGTSWLDTGKRDWSDSLLTATDLERSHMPNLVEGNSVSGGLRKSLAEKFGMKPGIPIAGGAGDNAASAVGLGVASQGDAFISLGTSGVLFAANDGYAPDPETALHTFCHALEDRWHQMGVILSAADSLTWYSNLIGAQTAELTSELGSLSAPGKTLFLPYLGGERTPHNDAEVRGAFLGLEHATDRKAGTRAVLEGVAFAFCDCLDAMKATGTQVTQLMAVGGGSNSQYWLKVISTALGVPIAIPADGDFGAAFGAARLAIMAALPAGEEIATKPKIQTIIEPDVKLQSQFDEALHSYRKAYSRVKEMS